MTSISGINQAAASSATGSLTGGNNLGKDDFLLLLVTQLQNQDPLNPQDPTEFTSQLAQYSSLEQLFTVNDQLQQLETANGNVMQLTALGLMGRDVVVQSDNFTLGSEPVTLGYRLSGNVDEVRIAVQNADGQTVATLQGTELSAGEHFMTWNGATAAGAALPAGDYQFNITTRRDGESTASGTALVKTRVTGVDLDGGSSTLTTGLGNYGLGNITSVRNG
jgi:flagellar basal-body rod modification protein FlgD